MKILITGANGLIGSHLTNHLKSLKSHDGNLLAKVFTCGRHKSADFFFDLKKCHSTDLNFAYDMDLIIHLAHDFSKNFHQGLKYNLEGTLALSRAQKKGGRFLYVSTFAAQNDPSSTYIYTKYQVEQELGRERPKKNFSILRPGLVIGSGGLFYKNVANIKKFKMAPILDKGKHPLPFISMQNLLMAISTIIFEKKKQFDDFSESGEIYHLFYQDIPSYADFISGVSSLLNTKIFRISIPSGPITSIGKSYEALTQKRWPLLDSLNGLRANTKVNRKSDLTKLIPSESIDDLNSALTPQKELFISST